jgi:hypothetical protein
LVRQTFDEENIGMKHGMIIHGKQISSQVLVKLLVKQCGFRVGIVAPNTNQTAPGQESQTLVQQSHDDTTTTDSGAIQELTHRYFRPGRADLIARIRFCDMDGNTPKQNHALTTTTSTPTITQWPSGSTATTIHLADERQYHSLLRKNPEKLWPASLDNDDDDEEASLEDEELDRTWDKEVSDGIDPIQFSNDRLTQIVPSHPVNRTDTDNDDDSLQRSRKLLLQTCWERAVHMASTSFAASIPGESEITTAVQCHGVNEAPSTTTRTRSMSEQACRRWNLQPRAIAPRSPKQHNDPDMRCSVCQNRYSSEEQLNQHFYGTSSTEGCCWMGIAYARRRFIRTALSKEVDVQRRLLLQTILEKLPPSTSNDAFGLLDTLDEVFHNSQRMALFSNQPVVLETLQVAANLPPLILNHDVLESARHRIVERYSTIRR